MSEQLGPWVRTTENGVSVMRLDGPNGNFDEIAQLYRNVAKTMFPEIAQPRQLADEYSERTAVVSQGGQNG